MRSGFFAILKVGISLLLVFAAFSMASFASEARAQEGIVKPEPSEPNAVPDRTDARDKRVRLPGPKDDAQTMKVLNNLLKRSGWFPELTIEVGEGVVTIKGRAKSADHLRWLAETADRIPTVVAVINQAEVITPPVSDFEPAKRELRRLVESAKKALPLLGLAIGMLALLLFAGKFIARGVQRLWSPHVTNPFLLSTVTRLTMLPIYVFFLFLVLQVAGLSSLATTIIGGTGALGIILGLAFKDIAENYLSGLLLSMRSPFTKGDEIQLDKYEGFVQSLNMRGTTIVDYDGNMVLIPNTIVIQSVIRNRTINPKSRLSFAVSIGVEDSVNEAIGVIYRALEKVEGVLTDPAPFAQATEVDRALVVIRCWFWVDIKKSSKGKTQSDAIETARADLLASGIDLKGEVREVVVTNGEHQAKLAERVAPAAAAPSPVNGADERDALRVNVHHDAFREHPDTGLLKN